MNTTDQHVRTEAGDQAIVMPAPTAWPFVLALGVSLAAAGLLTNPALSVLGGVLLLIGAVGWFRQVLPQEHHELMPVTAEAEAAQIVARPVARLAVAGTIQRAWLPLKVYPVIAGIKGGLAGGVAMALLAMLYGVIFFRSVWYPVNLIAGSLYDAPSVPPLSALTHFRFDWFLFALAMHITMCLLVGLLYGAMLPMLPTRPVVLGGIIAPLLWTGLVYTMLGFVNPLLDERINWIWFAASQVAFGVVAGLVVVRHHKQWTAENLPLAMRAGIEAPGIIHERKDEDKQP